MEKRPYERSCVMKKVKALIISGYGVNCEKEVAVGCELAGAEVDVIHAQKLLNHQIDLDQYQLIVFPGGFSFGDDLGAGKAFANRLSHSRQKGEQSVRDHLQSFVDRGGCILGICNGFQLLVKLNLLPGFSPASSKQQVSLVFNDSNCFENRWSHHRVLPSTCVFTKGLKQIYLPLRHGEGKFIASDDAVIQKLFDQNQIVFQYCTTQGEPADHFPENPNGSTRAIAGICDHTGRILGMMAHPEGFLFFQNHPNWLALKEQSMREHRPLEEGGEGVQLFRNAVHYLEENS